MTSPHTRQPTAPEVQRRVLAGIVAVALLVLGAVAGFRAFGPDHARPGPEPPATTAAAPPPTTPPTTAREQHPLVTLMARYDRLYARIVADRRILYNPRHPAHREMAGLLTADSPVQHTRIFGAFRPRYPHGWVQVAGSIRPEALRPGERNARLPMIHELLGSLPAADRDATVTVRACVHLDNRILDATGQGYEWAHDARQDATVTFRRVNGRWLLHTFVWEWRPCQRCGPEPAGTAHAATYLNGRPRTADPPCGDRRRL